MAMNSFSGDGSASTLVQAISIRADDRCCRRDGATGFVLLIEQKLTMAMAISERALLMGHGGIVFQGTPDSLRADASVRKEEWLEV